MPERADQVRCAAAAAVNGLIGRLRLRPPGASSVIHPQDALLDKLLPPAPLTSSGEANETGLKGSMHLAVWAYVSPSCRTDALSA